LAAFEADLEEDETGTEPADDEAPAVVIGPPRAAPEQADEEATTIIDATEAAETEEADEAAAQTLAIDEDEDEQEEDERGGDGPEVITPPPRPGSRTVAEPEPQGVSLDEQWSLDLQETETTGEGADPRAAHDTVEDETAESEVVEAVEEREEEEPTVTIPRPAEPVRQRRLFRDPSIDEGLVQEATDLVLESGRANAAHLQRRLRIDYEQAVELLGILAQRGVIHLEAGANQGRLLGDGSGAPVS